MNGMLIGPAPAQDTMRMNGADAIYISGSIVELAPSQTPKGSVGSSPPAPTSTQSSSTLSAASDPSALSASSVTDNNNSNNALEEVPHPIANKAMFDKGLSDG
jgi:hypothetical protein